MSLEHKSHEFRDLIGRDAEYVITSHSGSEIRFRGPITRITCEIDPKTLSTTWGLDVGWVAIKETNKLTPFFRGPLGRWNLSQEFIGEEEGYMLLLGGIFKKDELTEQVDGTLIKKVFNRPNYTELIIHRPGENLSLENIST